HHDAVRRRQEDDGADRQVAIAPADVRPLSSVPESHAIRYAMVWLKWTFIGLFAGYIGFLVLLYVAQRRLMYFPDSARVSAAAAGLPQAEDIVLNTPDGERVIAWHVPPQGERPLVLYLHGNGGALVHRAERFAALVRQGFGLLALDYRGYGGSTRSPRPEGFLIAPPTPHPLP